MKGQIVGSQPESYTKMAKEALATVKSKSFWTDPDTYKLWKMTGIGDVADVNPIMHGARRLNVHVENVNRLAGNLFLRRKGWSPAEATRVVDNAHVSYVKSSQFERKYMRPLVPFYTWPRRMAAEVVRNVAERPAGQFTQLARLERLASERDPALPAYMTRGSAIPLGGQDEEGSQAYLTNIGDFPPELFNRFASFGPGGWQQTGMSLLGNLTPSIKVPLELAMGRSLFDNRDLRDKEGRLGRLLAGIQTGDALAKAFPGCTPSGTGLAGAGAMHAAFHSLLRGQYMRAALSGRPMFPV